MEQLRARKKLVVAALFPVSKPAITLLSRGLGHNLGIEALVTIYSVINVVHLKGKLALFTLYTDVLSYNIPG